MKLDDRDIVCETDYSPLSSAELAAQIEWHASAMSGATDYDLERITGPARALLARAEAAEAERDDANLKALQAEYRVIQLAARVAELEAALIGMDGHMARLLLERNDALNRVDELEAAQGWRDFTEHPPIGEQIQITTVIDAVREEPDGLYRIGNTSEWQAWRPAPQEPTP